MLLNLPEPRRLLVLALLALGAVFGIECAAPTSLTVTVYSELACGKGSSVALVGGASLVDLAQRAPSSVSTKCDAEGGEVRMGSVVLVPSAAKDETVAFAVMQRADGQPADGCLDPAQASGCIVAKRQLRFERHNQSEMRVDLRLSCLGRPCSPEQTCVSGACVEARTICGASCGERALRPSDDGGAPDGSDDSAPAGVDAAATPGLLALAISAGSLGPAFRPDTLSYVVVPSVVSLGVPFTVTPTYARGSVTINGAAVLSGVASPVVTLNLTAPTPIDVTVTSAAGGTTRYAIAVPPVQEAYVKASNARANGFFGTSVALSGDTLAVGSTFESSNGIGINGNQSDTSAVNAGAVYIFTRSGATWSQQAYIEGVQRSRGVLLRHLGRALGRHARGGRVPGVERHERHQRQPARASAFFGWSVALSGDSLAVGATNESSNATGINGNQGDTSAKGAGAVYVLR